MCLESHLLLYDINLGCITHFCIISQSEFNFMFQSRHSITATNEWLTQSEFSVLASAFCCTK